jgi:hypothetical protein
MTLSPITISIMKSIMPIHRSPSVIHYVISASLGPKYLPSYFFEWYQERAKQFKCMAYSIALHNKPSRAKAVFLNRDLSASGGAYARVEGRWRLFAPFRHGLASLRFAGLVFEAVLTSRWIGARGLNPHLDRGRCARPQTAAQDH